MKSQELFDKISKHLLMQKRKSQDDYDSGEQNGCLYRHTEDGIHLSCAIGCLIDDAHYRWDLEGLSLRPEDNLRHKVIEAVEGSIGRPLTADEDKLLQALQVMHDVEEPDDWPKSLKRIANNFFVHLYSDFGP